jgi:hypothetical protein
VSESSIGLPLTDSALGVVSLLVGGNSWFGGPNTEAATWMVPLLHATVEVDGRVLVRNGNIVE